MPTTTSAAASAVGAVAGLTAVVITVGSQPLLCGSGSNTRHLLERALSKRRIAINPVLELGSREAVREAVALGLGIGFMQERETAGDNRVTPVRIDEMLGTNLATLVCLKRQAKRKPVAAMIRVARDLSSLP